MAYNAFLKLTGVEGEAEDVGFEKQIEIFSFSFGAHNPTTVGGGGGSGAGKVDLSSFNVMKKFDLSTPAIFAKCCAGKHFDEAQVTLCKAGGGDKPIDFLVYKFKEVFINSIQWSGSSGGDEVPTESVSFSFAECSFTYSTQTAKGEKGATVGGGWNIRKNAPVGGK